MRAVTIPFKGGWTSIFLFAAAFGQGRTEEPPGGPTPEEWKRTQERLDALEKRVRDKEDNAQKPDPKKEGRSSMGSVYDEGFWFIGPDDRLRLGGTAQFDARSYGPSSPGDDTFQIRRARLYATGTLEEKWGYMVMGRWDRGTPSLHFAWLESQHSPNARVRIGQFKEPYSLEAVNSDQYFDFNERSLWVSNLAPFEDIGAMLYGKLWDQRVEYGIGAFNGRGRERDDTNDDKEMAGQLTLAPFRTSGAWAIQGLNVSVSGSTGGAEDDLRSASYATAAQTRFWTYAANVVPGGRKERLSGEVEWLAGPASLKGGVHQEVYRDLRKGAQADGDLTIDGWVVWGTWVLTGEHKPRNRPVVPGVDFDPARGTWGALELAARYEQFQGDREFFQKGYVTGTSRADSATVGLNWYLNRHMRAMLDFQDTQFADAVPLGGGAAMHESTWTFRIQFEF